MDAPWTPLYPFGYGLSYTQFRLRNLQLSATRMRPDGRITVGVEVENIGNRTGDEVVQLYIRAGSGFHSRTLMNRRLTALPRQLLLG